MLINATEEEEVRVAIVEDGILQELDIQSTTKKQVKGNIYKGKVVNIEQGLQAAFVDFSGGKPGFLAMGEVQPKYWSGKSAKGRRRIQDVLKRGQDVLVQVTKDEIGAKGAALTSYLSLPGRYLVLMPGSDTTGISRKIEDEKKRKRLKEIMGQLELPTDMGLIVRTAGFDRTKSELAKDSNYLLKLWATIEQKSEVAEAPALIYQDLDVIIRAIRDYFSTDTSEILIDDPEVYRQAKAFFSDVMPRYRNKVKLYSENKPLFTKYELERQIETIYKRKLALKGGGSIIIEPTEAMVTIDVNSGRGVPSKGIEETAYQANLEAAGEIARQLRLRDLGGLVVIDFIDMKDRKHKAAVEREFKAAFKRDKARVQTSPITRFGLMELSRQRLRSPLWDVSFRACPTCHGQGVIKSVEAQSMSILRSIHEAASRGNVQAVRGITSAAVAEYLLNRKRKEFLQIESDYNVKVTLVGTAEILESEYDLEFVTREPTKEQAQEQAQEQRPARRRRRRRTPRKAGDEPHKDEETEEAPPAEEAQAPQQESSEQPRDAGGRLMHRLKPFMWWRFGDQEFEPEAVALAETQQAPQPVEAPDHAGEEEKAAAKEVEASGGKESPPRRRRSRPRSSRRRRSGRAPAKKEDTESSPGESPPGEASGEKV
jgi:ribonuclease E